MRTRYVVRGEEWLSSTTEHIQIQSTLFNGSGATWHYAHLPSLCVIDDESGTKRKISKRKDTFAAADWFLAAGYPMDGIYEYIMTLYFPSFEKWRIENPLLPHTDFAVDFSKLGNQSVLFDFPKFEHICKGIIARMTKSEIRQHAIEFGITNEKILQALEIDREGEKPRKDIAKFSDIPELFNYLIERPTTTLTPFEIEMLQTYEYKNHATREEWFADIKSYPFKPKYLTQAIRRALTGRDNTPDLFAIKQILGAEEVRRRLDKIQQS
jgi:glutamyl-tRNA synthetase